MGDNKSNFIFARAIRMKTRIFFSIGLLLVVCNSSAQTPSEPFAVGVKAPLTLKVDIKYMTKCNVEISIPGVGNVERLITAPNYETVIEITPQQEGQLTVQWKGKTKFHGFNTVNGCPGSGSVVVTAIAGPTTAYKVLSPNLAGSYSGSCKDGLAHGEGVAKGPHEYSGIFANGKPHGKGAYAWQNGDKYEGDWLDGKMHGKGTLTEAGGDKYEGDWLDGKMHGKGTLTLHNGSKYEGSFADGVFVRPANNNASKRR